MTSLIGCWLGAAASIASKSVATNPIHAGKHHKTDTMPKNKKKNHIKQSIIKELQDCCFAVALDSIYGKDKMSNTAKKETMYELVHGNAEDP